MPANALPTAVWTFALVATVALGAPAGAVAEPSRGLDPVEPVHADVAFVDPARVSGPLDVADWLLQVPRSDDGDPLPAFDLLGAEATATYVERTILPQSGWETEPKQTTRTLLDIDADLAFVGGPSELEVGHGGGPLEIRDAPDWRLGTVEGTMPKAIFVPSGSAPAEVDRQALFLEREGGSFHAEGSVPLYIYGFNVTIRHREGTETYTTGLRDAWAQSGLPVPDGAPPAQTESYLVLRVEEGSFTLATDRPVRIVSHRVALVGSVEIHDAHGRIERDGAAGQLDGKRMRLDGAFDVTPGTGSSADTHEVAFDGFAFVQASSARFPVPSLSPTVVAGGTAALALLLGLGAWLYTRLRHDTVADHPRRRAALAAVEQRPGLTVDELAATLGVHANTARYHVRVLETHGRVRAYRTRGTWRVVPATVDVARARAQAVLAGDPAVACLVDDVGPDGVPASRAVRVLQGRLGLSRSRGWRIVDRAVDAGLLVRERQGRRVVLRLADAGPS